jgi:hypothetical protein
MKLLPIISAVILGVLLTGCVGRTGKVGTPIAAIYSAQLQSLQLGVTTPDDLKKCFTFTVTNNVTQSGQPQNIKIATPPTTHAIVTQKKVLVSLQEAKIENGKKVEVYEVTKGGGMDVAAFVVWGYVAYNKDQELLFRFEDGKLVSYESVVLPDPAVSPATPTSKTPRQ